MTSGDAKPDEQPQRRRRRWLKVLGIAAGTVAIAGVGLAVVGWKLLEKRLPPFLEDNLSGALGRPLKIGEFERFSLRGIRFGESILPPTADNYTWARAEGLDISFNPLELIFRRTLRPKVIFIEPQVAIKQGFNRQWQIEPPQSAEREGLIQTELDQLQVRNATLVIGPVARQTIVPAPEGTSSAALIVLENVNIRVSFRGKDNQIAAFVLGGRLNKGAFQLRGEGQLDTRQLNLAVNAQQIPVNSINPFLGGNLFVKGGMVSSNLDVRVRPEQSDPVLVKGTAQLRHGDFVITDLPSPISDVNGTLALYGLGGELQGGRLNYGPIQVAAKGPIDTKQGYALEVTIPQVTVAQVEEAFAQKLPIAAAGSFQTAVNITGPILQPQALGRLTNQGPVRLDRLGIDTIAADFSAHLKAFNLDNLLVRLAMGGTITAQGTADFHQNLARPDLAFTARTDIPLDGIATLYDLPVPGPLRLGSLVADAQLIGRPDDFQASALWSLQRGSIPGQGRAYFADHLLQARDTRFQIGAGTLTASADANLNNQNWQATVTGSALPLAFLSPLLRGTLDTNLQASGQLTALTLADTRASGTVRLSETVPIALVGTERILPGPLTAAFNWTGQRLEVPQAQAPNLYASGYADIDTRNGILNLDSITDVDFLARLTDFDLGAAYDLLPGPDWLTLAGVMDFDGRLRGNLQDPQITGQVGLRDLAINDLALATAVSGPVQASLSQGAQVDLRGEGAIIAADIAPDLRPNSFQLLAGDLVAKGQRQGNILTASLRNFDIGMLDIRPFPILGLEPDIGPVGGILNANATLDLTDLFDPDVIARFAIARPSLGDIVTDSLTGRGAYADGGFSLGDGVLGLTADTELLLAAQGRIRPAWQVDASVTTTEAQIQDILAILQLYQFGDFPSFLTAKATGNAADLPTNPVGNPDALLLDQAALARAVRQQQQVEVEQRSLALIPDLDQLEGAVSGGLTLSARQGGGLNGLGASFDLRGENWRWGRYAFENQFVARGGLANGRLTLDPVEFLAGDTRISLLGNLSPTAADLQFRAEHLQLTTFAKLAELPIAVTGDLNIAADLSGSLTNPQMVGLLSVDDASVNQQPIQEISSGFQYQDAYFSVEGRVRGDASEPLLFSGTVPYALPFMTVQPTSNQIDLRASLKNDALSLINLLTPVVSWGGGEANIDLRLGGTLQRPSVNGVMAFNGANFNSEFLNTSLSNLTGSLRFTGDRLVAENLTGEVMEGAIALHGSVPLLPHANADGEGLLLSLQDINFNYADEIRSRVNGQLTLTNTLINPVLGGTVLLQDTEVRAGRETRKVVHALLIHPDIGTITQVLERVPARFEDLRVVLEPASVKAPPLFAADVEGDVRISGPIAQPYGDGLVRLTDSWIQTVTTEFFLEGGRDNVARFKPEYGLDPYLDLLYFARVPLQRRYDIASQEQQFAGNTAEVPDLDPLASTTVFDEIQIEARVRGPASRLFENLALTSSPPQPSDSLLGMVSGGYLSDLGGAEPSLVLGANLLTAFTNATQDNIGDALGLRRFRLGATTVLPTDDGDTFGYGVGLNLGITEELSTTLVQVLNQNQPIQLNARYRISDQWGIQGSTNFGNENRLFLEYRVNLK